jgi:KDO2-lipid IV(A) lauroyltransferase
MRAVAWAIARLPWAWLGALGAVVGWLAGSLVRIRRRQVEAALAASGFEGAPAIARAMYRSLGAGLAELLWLAGRPPAAIAPHFTMTPAAEAALARAAARGRGVVVATAHTGNWDLTACAAAEWLGDARALTVVTKRLSWRALDRYWQRLRAERGVRLVDAAGAASAVRDALAQGGVVALLVDQAPERRTGVAVLPFLARDAKHDLAPALLAARAKAPIVVLLGRRDERGHHVLEVWDEISPEEQRGKGAALRTTARITAALERFVRAHPAQWLWLHRRWK